MWVVVGTSFIKSINDKLTNLEISNFKDHIFSILTKCVYVYHINTHSSIISFVSSSQHSFVLTTFQILKINYIPILFK